MEPFSPELGFQANPFQRPTQGTSRTNAAQIAGQGIGNLVRGGLSILSGYNEEQERKRLEGLQREHFQKLSEFNSSLRAGKLNMRQARQQVSDYVLNQSGANPALADFYQKTTTDTLGEDIFAFPVQEAAEENYTSMFSKGLESLSPEVAQSMTDDQIYLVGVQVVQDEAAMKAIKDKLALAQAQTTLEASRVGLQQGRLNLQQDMRNQALRESNQVINRNIDSMVSGMVNKIFSDAQQNPVQAQSIVESGRIAAKEQIRGFLIDTFSGEMSLSPEEMNSYLSQVDARFNDLRTLAETNTEESEKLYNKLVSDNKLSATDATGLVGLMYQFGMSNAVQQFVIDSALLSGDDIPGALGAVINRDLTQVYNTVQSGAGTSSLSNDPERQALAVRTAADKVLQPIADSLGSNDPVREFDGAAQTMLVDSLDTYQTDEMMTFLESYVRNPIFQKNLEEVMPQSSKLQNKYQDAMSNYAVMLNKMVQDLNNVPDVTITYDDATGFGYQYNPTRATQSFQDVQKALSLSDAAADPIGTVLGSVANLGVRLFNTLEGVSETQFEETQIKRVIDNANFVLNEMNRLGGQQ